MFLVKSTDVNDAELSGVGKCVGKISNLEQKCVNI